jgi:hypothetical protein
MCQGCPEGVCAYRFDGSQLNLGTRRQEPRSWAEKAYHNLTYFNEVDKGGHFAA